MEGGTTVLVVDDDASLRLLCRINLELEGFGVLEAGSLDAARKALESGPVDAVLLDVHVGHEDGLELLRELAGRESRPGVALLTGSAQLAPATVELADAVIGKPFRLEELGSTVRRLFGAERAEPSASLDVDFNR